MRDVLQNSTRGFFAFMVDSTDLTTGLSGLTLTVTRSKNGAAFVSVSPTITDRGNGWYWVVPAAADRDTLGDLAWHITGTGAAPFPRVETVVAYDAQQVAVGANTTAPNNAAAQAAQTAAESADGKLTAGRLSRLDQLPDVLSGAVGGLAIVGSEMSLSVAQRGAIAQAVAADILNDGDGTAVLQAIADQIASDWVQGDSSALAVANATRDAILNRVLSGNHDTAGTVGLLLQFLDAAVSSRSSHVAPDLSNLDAAVSSRQPSGAVQVGSLTPAALAQFAADDTGEVTAAAGSVAKLAQGSAGTDYSTQLDRIESQTGLITGGGISVVSNVTPGGDLNLILGDDYTPETDGVLLLPVSDPGGALRDYLQSADSVIFGAGRDAEANQVTGTVDAGGIAYADAVSTIPIQIVNSYRATSSGRYVYHIKAVFDGQARTRVKGVLNLEFERAAV